MPHETQVGAVIFAKDIKRVAAFYQAVLGMTVAHGERSHIVLESAACELVIHAIPQRIADTIKIASPPERRSETPLKLFFAVASIAEARAQAQAQGGAFNPPKDEWTARGFRACDGHDPEGNVLQVRERERAPADPA